MIKNILQLPSKIAVALLKAYQLLVSPFMSSRCRFYPSCSNYAIEAYREFPFIKATTLTFKRLCKCHPWHPGGIDNLPDKQDQPTTTSQTR